MQLALTLLIPALRKPPANWEPGNHRKVSQSIPIFNLAPSRERQQTPTCPAPPSFTELTSCHRRYSTTDGTWQPRGHTKKPWKEIKLVTVSSYLFHWWIRTCKRQNRFMWHFAKEKKKTAIKGPQIVRIAFNFKTIEAINHPSLFPSQANSLPKHLRYFKLQLWLVQNKHKLFQAPTSKPAKQTGAGHRISLSWGQEERPDFHGISTHPALNRQNNTGGGETTRECCPKWNKSAQHPHMANILGTWKILEK